MQKKAGFKKGIALLTAFALTASSAISLNPTSADAATKKYVKSIKIATSKLKVVEGAKKTRKVTVKVKGKANKKVSVKSSDTSVASVKVGKPNKKGVSKITVTGNSEGTCKITVTTKGKNKKKKKLVKKFAVSVTGAGSTNNNSVSVTATPTPTPNNNSSGVSGGTSDTGDGNGNNGGSSNNENVSDEGKEVKTVIINSSETEITVGSSMLLTATALPKGVETSFTWQSKDTSVATVDEDGRVVGVNKGQTEIVAYADNGVSGSVKITVKAVPVTGVTLDNKNLNLTVGGTSNLKETVSPETATNRRVTWTSSDTKVATVDSNGKVTAIGPGTAEIIVETEDGAFKDTATVTVKEDSKEDVDGMTISVTNSLDDYPNTVLVGTRARISVKVTKNGAPVGNDDVDIQLMPVSGYTGYYEYSKQSIDLSEDGTGSFYVGLTSDHASGNTSAGIKKKGPMFTDGTDAAFASFTVKLTAGGANVSEEIPLSFAQVMPETENSLYALSVENQNDSALNSIVTSGSYYATRTSTNKEGYTEQYVVDQQVSSDEVENGDHKVVLDAAPLLVKSPTQATEASDKYEVAINHKVEEYTVYQDENSQGICTLEDVPGGLEYLTLYFSKLGLSKYSHLVVRAYERGTNYPVIDEDDNLVQLIIDSDQKTDTSATYQIKKEIFNETTQDMRTIDVKIFIESSGQVSEDDNIGFVLSKASGEYSNQEIQRYETEPLRDCVTWSCNTDDYTMERSWTTTEAQQYLGNYYNPNNTYKYKMPRYPHTGNAIITAYNANGVKTGDYFLYPTVAEDNANVLIRANSRYVFKATYEQIEALSVSKYTTNESKGKLTIDSKYAGYVPVHAVIQAFNSTVKYELDSFVQWSPIPGSEKGKAKDYYALAGQTVTLKAKVTDTNGNIERSAPIIWSNIDTMGVNVIKQDEATGSDGYATLQLNSTEALDVSNIYPRYNGPGTYNVILEIAGDIPVSGNASIHWVKPGLYYKADVDGDGNVNNVCSTCNEKTAVSAPESSYKNGTTWIVGTKVVGLLGDEEQEAGKEVVNISNIEIDMSSSSKDNVSVQLKDKANGVCTVTTNQIGNSLLTAAITGFINPSRKCVITIASTETTSDGKEIVVENDYESVGDIDNGTLSNGSALIIPIRWTTNGENIKLINNNTKFDISNTGKAHVYIQVQDINNNPVDNSEISYQITNASGETVDSDTTTTDANGLIDVKLKTPEVNTTYTVSAYFTNSNADTAKTSTVTFTDNSSVFQSNGNLDTSNYAKNEIGIIFNQKVNKATLDKDFFTVTNGTVTLDVESVSIDPSNTSKVIITTEQSFTTKDVTVEIESNYLDELGMVHYFLDDTGVLFTK